MDKSLAVKGAIVEKGDEASAVDVPEQSPSEERWANGLEWPAVLWIGGVHLGALAAPFCFTWKGLSLVFMLGWLTGGVGVCLGYHRLLAHSSYETFPIVRRFLAWLGMMSGEGPPMSWVAAHRKHHCFSDQEEDPHSPRQGRWWSHVLWMLPRYGSDFWAKLYRRYAPDLMQEPFMRFLNRTFLWSQFVVGLALLAVGWLVWDPFTGASLLVYGMFVRLVYVMHATWLINSATHIWGYKNYETNDDSRNLWWVTMLTYGEGWHNNHHAFQRLARHGHRWWELDITWITIRIMQKLGLAWNIVEGPTSAQIAENTKARG